MKFIYLIFLFLLACTNLFIDEKEYNSFAFKGGSWIEFPSIDSMIVQNYNFSIQFWVSGGEINGNEAPALFSITDENNTKIALYRDPNIKNSIILDLNSQIEKIEVEDIDWTESKDFHLISILFSDNGPTTIFIDSTNVHTTSLNSINAKGSKLIVGALSNEGRNILENFWYGYIDEIRLWNTSLHDSTIKFHYKNPNKLGEYYRTMYNDTLAYTADSDSLIYNSIIGLWRLNKNNTNSIIEDGSIYNNHGEIFTLPNFNIELSQIGSQ